MIIAKRPFRGRCGRGLLMLEMLLPPLMLAAAQQPLQQPPTEWPVLLPRWQPEWTLNRSTIAQPCNYSGWFSPELGAQFGIISFDWANNENSWRQRPLSPGPNNTCLQPRGWAPHCYYPVQEDLIEQAQKIKAVDNRTRVFVYRQGQGSPGAEGGKQGQQLSEDPRYSGFFLTAKGTNRSTGVFDFRNASVIDWFVETLVGGPTCLGHPAVDGLFLDDVDGLGSPGSPDATPIVKETGLAPSDVAAWNKGQRTAVIRAQKLAVERGKFNWQLLKPGIAGMLQPAPDAASCINGTNASTVGAVPFPGLRKLCSEDGAKLSRGVPLFMALWHDRGEADRWYGQGSCTETADCTLDQCKQDGGVSDVACVLVEQQPPHPAAARCLPSLRFGLLLSYGDCNSVCAHASRRFSAVLSQTFERELLRFS